MAKASGFGKEFRVEFLKEHFNSSGPFTKETAWKFVYQELLWIDESTGLAHLYESDKAQPGRSKWFDRTIAFTKLVSEEFEIDRTELKNKIDWLFRAGMKKSRAAVKVIETEASDDFAADVDLVEEFSAILVRSFGTDLGPARTLATQMVASARDYFTVGRKRQNILGEGFEDLLFLLAHRIAKIPESEMALRRRADKLPGFHKESERQRNEAPDLAIISGKRTDLLASIKWSLRHDRQKQLSDELDSYTDLCSQKVFPTYILVTNEYDPGRLVNTANLARSGQKIDRIYHINTEILLAVLADHPKVDDLKELMREGRLLSLEDFLREMREQYGN